MQREDRGHHVFVALPSSGIHWSSLDSGQIHGYGADAIECRLSFMNAC